VKERDRLALLRQTTTETESDKTKHAREASEELALKRTPFQKKLMRAGIKRSARTYIFIWLVIASLAAFVVSKLGMPLSVFVFGMLLYYGFSDYLEEKANKRKKKIVPQLPGFIDGLASALSTGFNIEGAIIQASHSVPPGLLRDELDKVVAALNRGFSVSEAMGILRERLTGREITSLVVALGLFSTMGGHVLEPFRRLAQKIREQHVVTEKAGRDLVMVRQAFYIIFGLSLLVPLLLIVVQPDYIGKAMNEPVGRVMFQVAAMMVCSALIGFKRITNLKI
jgi:tight adherence protein B